MITGHIFEKAINGPAHHTLHHLYFTVNYGQVSAPHLTLDQGLINIFSTSLGQIARAALIASQNRTLIRY